eukprot:3543604-Rhodomonas_salina.1
MKSQRRFGYREPSTSCSSSGSVRRCLRAQHTPHSMRVRNARVVDGTEQHARQEGVSVDTATRVRKGCVVDDTAQHACHRNGCVRADGQVYEEKQSAWKTERTVQASQPTSARARRPFTWPVLPLRCSRARARSQLVLSVSRKAGVERDLARSSSEGCARAMEESGFTASPS